MINSNEIERCIFYVVEKAGDVLDIKDGIHFKAGFITKENPYSPYNWGGGLIGPDPVVLWSADPRFVGSKEKRLKTLVSTLHLQTDPECIRACELAVENKWSFLEYEHIEDDPVIGGFISDNPSAHLFSIIAHEVAHCVDWWNAGSGFNRDDEHGLVWQDYYRKLKQHLIDIGDLVY